MKKRILSMLLSIAVSFFLLPISALAANIQADTPSLEVNSRKVTFGGYTWWVIGDETSGVYSQENHITLLAVDDSAEFKNVPFRVMKSEATEGYTQFKTYTQYYADNPDGMENWTKPNDYAGSTLQQKMEEIASLFPEKEQAVITARDLTIANDGITGQDISNQKLWALSEDELQMIGNSGVQKYNSWWWLRTSTTQVTPDGLGARQGGMSGLPQSALVFTTNATARPAFSLDLSSVLFTSVANQNGKSAASVNAPLVSAANIGENARVKFTMVDESQTLTVNATEDQSVQAGETLSFTYTGATTGTNQYVSCILVNESGKLKYYGKLADSSSAASGTLSIPLSGVADGTYTLQIFSEEANDILYTDFCSEPVTMTVTIASNTGTVSDFGGTILYEHNWSTDWTTDANYHWHECLDADCPVTENSQKDGYGPHDYNQEGVCTICGAADPNYTPEEDDTPVVTPSVPTITHTNGWEQTRDGEWVYYQNGRRVSGWIEDKGISYYLDEDYTMVTGWKQLDGKWYYFYTWGGMAEGWVLDNGIWYYLDPTSGAMQTGWKQLDGKWYYFYTWGGMAEGWVLDNGIWYYLDPTSGAMQTGWKYLNNKWYYFYTWGGMAKGWVLDNDVWYYLDPVSGAMATGWKWISNKWYYLYTWGGMAYNTTIDGYYLGADGAMR